MTLGDLRQYVKVRPPQFLSVRKHTHFLHTRCYRVHILCMFPPKPVHLPLVHTIAIVWDDRAFCTYHSQLQKSILPVLEEGHNVESSTVLQSLNSVWNIFTDFHIVTHLHACYSSFVQQINTLNVELVTLSTFY